MSSRPRRLGALIPPVAVLAVAVAALGLSPASASARRLTVDLWTDRGDEGIYRPGDRIEISARLNADAYLLVYEIDAEGYVHVLHPYGRSDAYVEGPTTVRLPDENTDLQLVTEAPAGEGYIVAIASEEPFERMPWYLRPYDAERDEYGYRGVDDGDELEGVTREGRIVGDPFVAMERIRREVLVDADERGSFSTAYTSYFVHDRVRYPRYLCYDCHRPGQWRWWDGFDPYYTSCNVFDFRVNVGWWWGPSYWFGTVPYYVYTYRPDCPPHYRHGTSHYSSWDGWRTWSNLWGPLRRYKSAPPAGYLPPSKYDVARRWKETGRNAPPGFLASAHQTRERRGPGFGRSTTDPGGGSDRGERRQFSGPTAGDKSQNGQGRARRGGFDLRPRERGDGGGEVEPRERKARDDDGVTRERKGRGDDAVPRGRREREPVDRPARGRDEQPTQGGKQRPDVRRERPGRSDRAPAGSGKADRRGLDEARSRSFAPRFERRAEEPRFERRATAPRFERRAAEPRFERRAAEPGYERRGPEPRYERRAPEPRYERRAPEPRFERRAPEPRFERRAEPVYDRRPEPRHERREAPAPRNDPQPRFEAPKERRESPPAGAHEAPSRGGGGYGRRHKGN